MRKGTIQPNMMRLGGDKHNKIAEPKKVNFKHYMSRQAVKGNFGIEGLLQPADPEESKDKVQMNFGWVYDFITCLELVVKENNTKSVMNKYCAIFK